MKEERIPKIILDYKPEDRRNVSKPKKKWIQLFNETGTSLKSLTREF